MSLLFNQLAFNLHSDSTINLNYAITLSFFLAIYILIFPFLCFVEPYR